MREGDFLNCYLHESHLFTCSLTLCIPLGKYHESDRHHGRDLSIVFGGRTQVNQIPLNFSRVISLGPYR